MIITGLSARNVLKYSQLELSDLPENGLIAVEGANESGKSSIGEMICFVLYGQTYSLTEGELNRLIKWGELNCSVTLRFVTGDRIGYEVSRFLDHDGNQSARLSRIGAEHEPIARGTEQVQSNLNALLGYNYEEFIESFYLAQREITTPHPHSHAVKAMAGLSVLEKLSGRYGDEITVEKQLTADVRQQAEVLKQELEGLDIEPGKLESQQSEQKSLLASRIALQKQVQQLHQVYESYQGLLPKYREATASRRRTGQLRFVMLILTLLLAGAWGMLYGYPGSEFSREMAVRLGERQPWILYGAVLCAGLFLFLWWRMATKGTQVNSLRAACREETEALQVLGLNTDQEEGEGSADNGNAPVIAESDKRSIGVGNRLADLHQRVMDFELEADELGQIVGARSDRLNSDLDLYKQKIDHLEQQIRGESKRVDRANGLLQAGDDLEKRILEHERRIAMRFLARDLLTGATRHFSQVFNRNLRELVGRTLPLLTEQRYEYLHIDEELAVSVFSKEKRDFVKLEELSSGTQRQVMLALRLALSQELVNKAVQGKQFLFLDEPFAFFDQERTRNAISVLPRLSDEITQIWVVAQEFPDNFQFDRAIPCARDQSTLNVAAPEDESSPA